MGLKGRVVRRINTAVEPILEPGETVEVAAVAQLGKVTARKQVAVAAAAIVISGGMMGAFVVQRKAGIVLTSRRLLVLEANQATGRFTGKVLTAVTRDQLRARPSRSLLTLAYEITDTEGTAAVRLSFPLPYRNEARAIAAALGAAP